MKSLPVAPILRLQRQLGQIEVSVALVTLPKHSHRVCSALGLPPAAAPHLTSGSGEGGSVPGQGASAQERCQPSWGLQALSSAGVLLTWDQMSHRKVPCCVPPAMFTLTVPQ